MNINEADNCVNYIYTIHLYTELLNISKTTVKVLSIGTDRSEQTVQTQNSLIRVYSVCYSILTFLGGFWQCKTIPLHFYNNNGNHDSVPIFRIFTVYIII